MGKYINYFDFSDKIFFTLSFIMVFTGIMYTIARKFGRPIVFGGILSGFILSWIPLPIKYFDIESCTLIGNIGMVLFIMFLGSEFNFRRVVSNKANLFLPVILFIPSFSLGFISYIVLLKFNLINIYSTSHQYLVASFIGLVISMSSFSILLMFVSHTNLKYSKVGKLAILCSSVEEVAFWVIFGVFLVYFQQNYQLNINKPLALFLYLPFIYFIAPRVVKFIVNRIKSRATMIGFIISGCFLSCVLSDLVNLHQIFGGFVFGLMLPKENELIYKIRDQLLGFIIVVLLPIYFVKTGIDASANLSLDSVTFIVSTILIITSLVGKYGGALIVGRFWSFSNKDVLILGSLLSIRGTVAIAVLNIGNEVGLINPKIYTSLVIMSLVTNWIATTVYAVINKKVSIARS